MPTPEELRKRADLLEEIRLHATSRQTSTDNLKESIRRAREADVPVTEIAEAARVNRVTVYEWMKS